MMVRRRLFLIATLAIWLAVLALVGKVSINRLAAPVWGNPTGDESSAQVAGNSRVGQVFTAPYAGLYRVEIVVAGVPVSGSSQVTFHVASSPDATSDLKSRTFDASTLLEGSPLSLEFDPVRTSKGQRFYFFLESDSPSGAEGITLGYDPQSVLDGATAYLDGRPIAGNLEFRTYYSLRSRDKVDLLLTRLSEGRPYFLGTKGFYILLAVAYCLVLGVFLLYIAQRIIDEGEGGA